MNPMARNHAKSHNPQQLSCLIQTEKQVQILLEALKRRYFTHSCENYFKRVSEFNSIPGYQIYEYWGSLPIPHPHGNRRYPGPNYVRTKESVLEKIKSSELHQPPLKIYSNFVRSDPLNAPRNMRQVRNTLPREKIQK